MNTSNFRKIKITPKRTQNWLDAKLNVMLVGDHGVGKTSMVKDAFESRGWEMGKDYIMFSGATLDPWTDLIGIPQKGTNELGEDCIKYLRPETMDVNLKAIFMDEFNRANKKVRNAVMELIQFKSINGRKFPNLEVVWAACNPHEDSGENGFNYDVEEDDAAQNDRFHVVVRIPYEPDKIYFQKKFGDHNANQGINWWNQQGKHKSDVSPRRLDYALSFHRDGGDISDILPITCNVGALKEALATDPFEAKYNTILEIGNDVDQINEMSEFLADQNAFDAVTKRINSDSEHWRLLSEAMSSERVSQMMENNDKFFEWSTRMVSILPKVETIMKSIFDSIDDPNKYDSTRYNAMSSLFGETKHYIIKNNSVDMFTDFKPSADVLTNLNKKIRQYADIRSEDVSFLRPEPKNGNAFIVLANKYSELMCDPSELGTEELCILAHALTYLSGSYSGTEDFMEKSPHTIPLLNTVFAELLKRKELTKTRIARTFNHLTKKYGNIADKIYIYPKEVLFKNETDISTELK